MTWYDVHVTKGNVTMIEATPMITTPTSNCSNNQKECESIIGHIFKTAPGCTNTSIYNSNSVNDGTNDDNDTDETDDSQLHVVIEEYDGCDERNGVTRGLWDLFNNSISCYTNKEHYFVLY